MKQIEAYVHRLLRNTKPAEAAEELIALLTDSATALMEEHGWDEEQAQRMAIERFEADADVQRLYLQSPKIAKPWRILLLAASLVCLCLVPLLGSAQHGALVGRYWEVWNEQYGVEQQLAQYLYGQREDPASMVLSEAEQQAIQTILAPRFAQYDVQYAALYAFSYAELEEQIKESKSVVWWLDTRISEEVDRLAYMRMEEASYAQAVYVVGDTSLGRRPDFVQGVEPNRYGERENLWRFTNLHGPLGSPPVYWYVEYMFGPDGRYSQWVEISGSGSYLETYSPMETALYTQVKAPYAALAVAAYIAYDVLFACWALIQMRRHGDAPLFWRLLVWLLGWPGYAVYWLVRHRKWDTDAALI